MNLSAAQVAELISEALDGDETAWRSIVDRYSVLVWSVCRTHRLSESDAADVSQTVFLRLVEHLPSLRQAPALPGWIRTTARRECLRVIGDHRRVRVSDADDLDRTVDDDQAGVETRLLAAERRAALRDAFAGLPARCRELLGLMMADRPLPYAEIAAHFGTAIGSIGPTRRRCLDQLRDSAPLADLAYPQISISTTRTTGTDTPQASGADR